MAEPTDALWWTRPKAATFLGISASQFGTAIAPRLSESSRRKRGTAFLYHGPAVIQAYVDFKVAKTLGRKTPGRLQADDDDADLWSAFDSPNLERLRAAKADQAELDVAERTGKVIFVDEMRDRLTWMLAQIKSHGERLQATFGREAAILHNEFLDDLKAFDVDAAVCSNAARASA